MNKEVFLNIVTQKETWDLTELLNLIGMTSDELTAYILKCKNELECKVEGLYTCQGFPITKTISFKCQKHVSDHEPISLEGLCCLPLTREDTVETIAKKIIKDLEHFVDRQRYLPTRGIGDKDEKRRNYKPNGERSILGLYNTG